MINREGIKRKFKEKYHTAIVTGAAGFIGSHLVEELLYMGTNVIAIDNFSAGKIGNLEIFLPNDKLSIVKCDVSDFSALENHFKDVDIVFHNAASKKNICLNDPARDLDVNAKGTLNIMLLSKKYRVKKIIHASTGSVYGEPYILPLTEEHPLNPVSYYGVSKLAGERYVDVFGKLHEIDVTILRYFHVYGPRQEFDDSLGGVVAIFIHNLLNEKPVTIHGDGEQIRSFTYVKDLVNINMLVAIDKSSKGQVYNCASGVKISIKRLYDMLLDLIPNRNYSLKYEESLIGDIKYFDIDNDKVTNLGIEFTAFDLGLNRTLEYLNGNKTPYGS